MMMIGIGIPMTQSSIDRMDFPLSVPVLNGRRAGKFRGQARHTRRTRFLALRKALFILARCSSEKLRFTSAQMAFSSSSTW